jgi:hypothetical protein
MSKTYDREAAARAVDSLALCQLNHEISGYWLSLWQDGRLPTRGAINPARLGKFLPGLAIMEIHPDASVRFRIAGRIFRAAFGFDPSRHDMMALTLPEQRAARLARCKAIVDGAVGAGLRTASFPGEADVIAQDVLLPLGGESEDGARAWLFHSSWRPGAADWSRSLPAQTLGIVDNYMSHALS